ncbi:hypothetical protein AB0M11_08045 [Streptomyces sp. NPDC051987]|uniref:hypothetical protein n=1 Tax=Streptomyces sp. NPDC051987 TaxID=3155808 RepID=UPI0034485F8A
MPESRSALLRAALENALGGPVDVIPAQRGVRITAPAPADTDWDRWHAAIGILRQADSWGSHNYGSGPHLWAEVIEP